MATRGTRGIKAYFLIEKCGHESIGSFSMGTYNLLHVFIEHIYSPLYGDSADWDKCVADGLSDAFAGGVLRIDVKLSPGLSQSHLLGHFTLSPGNQWTVLE